MLMIRPKTIDDAALASSSVAASENVWNAASTYGLGDRARVDSGLDLNFLTGAYTTRGSLYGSVSSLPGYSYTRSGTIAVVDSDLTIDSFGANTPPIDSYYHAWGSLTNTIWQSQDFSSLWTLSDVVVTTNATTAPDGTATADKVTPNTNNVGHAVQPNGASSIVPLGISTISVFAKAAGYSRIGIRCYDGTAYRAHVTFDVSAGTIVNTQGGTGYIISLGSGWYRCVVVTDTMLAAGSISIDVQNNSTLAQVAYAGDASSGVYLWQAQTFTGSFADGGPLIATASGSATIGAPAFVMNCANGDYTATYTFDDNSTQSVDTTVSGGQFMMPTYPLVLNRPRVKHAVIAATRGADGHRLYESLSGGTSATATMTIASPCVVTWTAHGLAANTPILFNTSGALPTGIVAGTVYYVSSPSTNTFSLSATAGGAAINTSGSQSGTHTATANPNKNQDPTTQPTFWLDIGPSNRWAMFDNYNGTVTTDASAIDVTLNLTGRADSLALLNLESAVSARVVVSTIADGTLYDHTYTLTSTEGISDLYSWFFEEIERKSNLLLTDLPSYNNPTVRVLLTGTGTSTLECGTLVVGQSKDLGRTLHDGAQIGIIDYSRKDVDAFGNYTIVERAFSKRGSFRMRIAKAQVDGIQSTLATYRATPAVYSASADYGSTLIFGFFREFNIEIDYPTESLVSIEIEGLT